MSNSEENEDEFYTKAKQYWSDIPATVDGMLGGFGFISQTDIRDSKVFLKQLLNSKNPPGRDYVLDCGAGIGRISKFLLTDVFNKVDLVEQNPQFLEQAKAYLGTHLSHKIGNYYSVGLQKFQPEEGKYDVIWIQWVLPHLTNDDLVTFLKRCIQGLNKNGMIVVKENVTSNEEAEMDEVDSSMTRSIGLYKKLFEKAGQLCDKHPVATPVDWKQGQDVMVQPTLSEDKAKELFPAMKTVPVPSQKTYLRKTPI